MKDYTACLALGANLGDPPLMFKEAKLRIEHEIGAIVSSSSIHRTAALNPPGAPDNFQPDYHNAVILVQTVLEPLSLIEKVLAVEKSLGRDRESSIRWGPRIIDIDIIFIDDLVLKSEKLTIPHPEFHRRDFVLLPMREICPEYTHPILGLSVRELANAI